MWLDVEDGKAAVRSDSVGWALMELKPRKNRRTGEETEEWKVGPTLMDLSSVERFFLTETRKADKYGRTLYVPGTLIIRALAEYNLTLSRIHDAFPKSLSELISEGKVRFPPVTDAADGIRLECGLRKNGSYEWSISVLRTTDKGRAYWKQLLWYGGPQYAVPSLYRHLLMWDASRNERALGQMRKARKAIFDVIGRIGLKVPGNHKKRKPVK